MDFVTDLSKAVIVDRAGLNKLPTNEMAPALAEIYGRDKPVIIMDNTASFFSDTSLFSKLDNNGPDLDMILEKRGIILTEEQWGVITSFHDLKGYILTQIEALRPPPPPYEFAKVPDGWTVLTHLRVSKSRVIRHPGNGYYMTIKQAQQLWEYASQYWAGNTKDRFGVGREYGTHWKVPEFTNTSIRVGCQEVQRYEMEQLALSQGWVFPQPKTAKDCSI